ncbi:superoxide dismutase [Deinococcus humi]|uniref:Superoxide dismutase n=1 Tax=Deinococcus humi TaxID=662880 RepID=A0A7W8JVC9_9DEIO|nr:Fe-Mn family superoxide dismutase [Deinococcus humi]MBB5363625.1 superoxide dismutase [Deinococcus humi]GGO30003.1 hypothetical protein GCM10008949_24280 [Deinococcus humi]
MSRVQLIESPSPTLSSDRQALLGEIYGTFGAAPNMFRAVANSPTALAAHWVEVPTAIREVVRNNTGGHLNHSFFWPLLTPSGTAMAREPNGRLRVMSTAIQDTPLTEGVYPLLRLDSWTHAYYLKDQNRRAEYVQSFWNVVNSEEVERRYRVALGLARGHRA